MFRDRQQAGIELAKALRHRLGSDLEVMVVAVPRGGVVVGYQVARAFNAELDILVARKLGAPGQPELGIGALAGGQFPETVLNQELIANLDVSPEYLAEEVARQLAEIDRRQAVYRSGLPPLSLRDRTVIVVDDGVATGGSIRAVLRSVRRSGAGRIILAVPVAPPDTMAMLCSEADELICLVQPDDFEALGQFYDDFSQTSDEEVVALLRAARAAIEKDHR